MLGEGIVSFGVAPSAVVPEEREVVAEDRLAEADPAVDAHRRRGELDRAVLVAELDLQLARRLADAVEARR